MRRASWIVSGAVVAAFALAACTPPVPAVNGTPTPELGAAVVDAQVQRIVPETFAELAAADEAKDATLLTDRVGADAKAVRAAEYKQASAKDGAAPAELPSTTQAVYVSAVDTWPRLLVAVTAQPADQITPVVMLWVQDDVLSDYQLRGWAHMVPGATLPAMAGPSAGAAQLPLDSTDVTPSPGTALADYLELLRKGEDSDLNAQFAPDSYRDRLFTARTVLTKAAKAAGGAYVDTIQPDEARTYAFQTADGGALVFAPVSVASAFSVKNATVSVPATDQPLVVGKLTSKVTHRYLDLIVIYIPGPATGAKPGIVAADHHLIKVSPS